MLKRWFVAALCCILLKAPGVWAQDIPQPSGWVNDFANVLSADDRAKITSLIEELRQKTTAEVFVVTVNSIAPFDEKAYARTLFDNWKPGEIGKDNGVLVLVAIKERRWRIETGYGVEGILPDGLCGEIGRNYMVPYFKQGNYGQGLYEGVVRIIGILGGDSKAESITHERSQGPSDAKVYAVLLGLMVIAGVLLVMPWRYFFATFGLLALTVFLLKIFVLVGVLIFFFLFVSLIKLSQRASGGYSGSGHRSGGWGGGGFGGGGFGGGGGGGGGF